MFAFAAKVADGNPLLPRRFKRVKKVEWPSRFRLCRLLCRSKMRRIVRRGNKCPAAITLHVGNGRHS
jgi:hypothetical protein